MRCWPTCSKPRRDQRCAPLCAMRTPLPPLPSPPLVCAVGWGGVGRARGDALAVSSHTVRVVARQLRALRRAHP
eukprot:5804688-Prymnesium_polylepis.2